VLRDAALALVRDHAVDAELDLPRELYRVELSSGSAVLIHAAPPTVFLAEIDWVDAP
jgi:hypothetical protein